MAAGGVSSCLDRSASAPYRHRVARPRRPLRSHGPITVTQLPDGRWRARATARDPDGVLRRPERHSPEPGRKGRAAAKRALEEHLAERWSGEQQYDSDVLTVAVLAQRWLDDRNNAHGTGEVPLGTIRSDRAAINNHIVDRLGALLVTDLTVRTVNRFLEEVTRGAGAGAAKNSRRALSAILNRAVREGYLDTNPVQLAEPVRRPARRERSRGHRVGTLDTRIEKLLIAVDADPWAQARDSGDITRMLVTFGCRISELRGLNWPAVTFESEDGPLIELGASPEEPGGKTPASLRQVTIDDTALEVLQRRWATAVEPYGPVFPSPRDPRKALSSTFADRLTNRLYERLGFGDITTHTFRHAVATFLDEAGFSGRQIADYLGHENPSVTLDVYMRRGAIQPAVSRALDRRFGR